jgi:SAM-dependent methyltransferase
MRGIDQKPATAARIYDYHLGGTHNFPADRAAAQAVTEVYPLVPAMARANRAFLRRAVRYLVGTGIRQFLDVGSGIPTQGNVHEIAQALAPDARVVYVDIDPVAVAEGQEILERNPRATAIRGDLRAPQEILDHPQVRKLLDLDQPTALLLCAVLHFVTDDEVAHTSMARLRAAVPPGSHLVVSHATTMEHLAADDRNIDLVHTVYRRQTATPFTLRSRCQIEAFFAGLEMVEPGLTWVPLWRPDPDDPSEFTDCPTQCCGLAGVGRSR